MKVFNSLASLDQIRGSPLSPMLQGIVVGMLGHFHYDPADDGYVVLVEPGDIDRPLAELCLPYRTRSLEMSLERPSVEFRKVGRYPRGVPSMI